MNRLKFTLKAWPVIAVATIGISLLTLGVANLIGIDLPDQSQMKLVRDCFSGAFDNLKAFLNLLSVLLQVLVLAPALEETLFRLTLFKLPTLAWRRGAPIFAVASSAIFSFVHYIDYAALVSTGSFALTGWNAAFAALFFFGLAQCWLYKKTERVWCPILNHALFNLFSIALCLVIPE